MSTDTKKQMKRLRDSLAEAGCAVENGGGGHIKISRNGHTMTMPSTPSDHRSVLNAYAEARRIFGVPVYLRAQPKKRKESVDDWAMRNIRKRARAQQDRGVTVSDLARLSVMVAEEKHIKGWKNEHSALEGIRVILKDEMRRLTRTRHDALAAALKKLESSDEKALALHLERAATHFGGKRINPGLKKITGPAAPATETPRPEPEVVKIAAVRDEDPPAMVINVELGPATRSMLRELVNQLSR